MSKHYKLEIKLNNINDVPEVYVDGEKMKIINSVDFHWYTASDDKYGDPSFSFGFFKPVKDSDRIKINQISIPTPEVSCKFDLNR